MVLCVQSGSHVSRRGSSVHSPASVGLPGERRQSNGGILNLCGMRSGSSDPAVYPALVSICISLHRHLPGKYQLLVNSKVSGRNLSAASTVNVWSNKQINMNIATKTFTVASVPNGKVYINDKFAGKLDEKGYLKFNEYPISKNMTLYVTTSYKDKKLKSIDVNDLGTALDIAVEKSSIFYPK